MSLLAEIRNIAEERGHPVKMVIEAALLEYVANYKAQTLGVLPSLQEAWDLERAMLHEMIADLKQIITTKDEELRTAVQFAIPFSKKTPPNV